MGMHAKYWIVPQPDQSLQNLHFHADLDAIFNFKATILDISQ